MAAFPNGLSLTRPDFAGANSDVDIHMEEHTGIVDSQFAYTSEMSPFIDIRSTNNSNQLRLERLSSISVQGVKVGDVIKEDQYRQEKFVIEVDTTLITRAVLNDFDLWTQNRDYRREYAEDAGTQLATLFDQAVLIQAIHAPSFVPPASLGSAFKTAVSVATDVATTDISKAAAAKLVAAHRQSIEQLINRNLGSAVYREGITFVTPRIFSILLQHEWLTNVQYGAAGTNDFVGSKIGRLNGVRVMETARFPDAVNAAHPLGAQFTVTEADLKSQMVTIIPSLSILAAQTKPLTAESWRDPKTKSTFLDTYQAYNLGTRRPDSIAIVTTA